MKTSEPFDTMRLQNCSTAAYIESSAEQIQGQEPQSVGILEETRPDRGKSKIVIPKVINQLR